MALSKREVAELSVRLEESGPSARQEILQQMVEAGEAAVPYLIQHLESSDYRLRGAAAEALGEIAREEAIPSLIELLADSSVNAQRSAAEALTKVGEAAVEDLLDALAAKDQGARRWAAEALGGIGDASVDVNLVRRAGRPQLRVATRASPRWASWAASVLLSL